MRRLVPGQVQDIRTLRVSVSRVGLCSLAGEEWIPALIDGHCLLARAQLGIVPGGKSDPLSWLTNTASMAPCSMSLLCYPLLSCQLSLIHDAPWPCCPPMEPGDGLPFPCPGENFSVRLWCEVEPSCKGKVTTSADRSCTLDTNRDLLLKSVSGAMQATYISQPMEVAP